MKITRNTTSTRLGLEGSPPRHALLRAIRKFPTRFGESGGRHTEPGARKGGRRERLRPDKGFRPRRAADGASFQCKGPARSVNEIGRANRVPPPACARRAGRAGRAGLREWLGVGAASRAAPEAQVPLGSRHPPQAAPAAPAPAKGLDRGGGSPKMLKTARIPPHYRRSHPCGLFAGWFPFTLSTP